MGTGTDDPGTAAQLVVGTPQGASRRAVFVNYVYGLLLAVPVLAAMMAVSVLPFSWLTYSVPLLTLAAATFFLPIGFGNPHVTRLVRSRRSGRNDEENGFIVQVTLSPRVEGGVRGLIEDADDFGFLSFGQAALRFEGDCVNVTIPYGQIEEVRRRSIGWRGLFLCKQRVAVLVRGLREVDSLEFAERCSLVLPASRTATRKLYERLCAVTGKGLV